MHAILRFGEPVVIESDQDRRRWSGIIQVVQTALPIDGNQPGITAMTRPIGSTNSKTGATVTRLTAGESVTSEEVLGLYREMRETPFLTVFRILTGRDQISPCPLCNKHGSRLSALSRAGRCYENCGTVSLPKLYDMVLKPHASEGGSDAAP